MEEPRHKITAYVRHVEKLMKCKTWEEHLGGGVTHLILEDEDDFLKTIPNEVTRMTSLWSFTLKKSRVKSIPSQLFTSEIRQLSFQECPIRSVDGIQTMTDLVSLELIQNNIQRLPNDIGLLASLVKLVVSKNTLKSIPPSVGRMQNLTTLNLCANGITELPDSITDLVQLTHLDLSHNQLRALPAEIGKLVNLVTIVLSHNHVRELPPSSDRLPKLRHLMVGNNRFASVPKSITKLPNLLTVNMASNHVTEMPTASLSMQVLILDKNCLTEMPHPVFLCQRLEKLSLQHNRITEISPLILHLKQLRALHLDGNPIERLPDEICQLTAMKQLTLRGTQLAELPMHLDSLRELVNVELDDTPLNYVYKNALSKSGVRGLLEEVATQRELLTGGSAGVAAVGEKPKVKPEVKPKPKRGDSAARHSSVRGRSTTTEPFTDSRHPAEPMNAQTIVTQSNQEFIDPRMLKPPDYGMSVGCRKTGRLMVPDD